MRDARPRSRTRISAAPLTGPYFRERTELAEGEVVQVKAVGGDPVSGAGRQLPPELGALGVAGEEEQAGEDSGAVLVELALGPAGGSVGEAADVGRGAGCVDRPPAYGRQLATRPRSAGKVHGGRRRTAVGVCGKAVQGGARPIRLGANSSSPRRARRFWPIGPLMTYAGSRPSRARRLATCRWSTARPPLHRLIPERRKPGENEWLDARTQPLRPPGDPRSTDSVTGGNQGRHRPVPPAPRSERWRLGGLCGVRELG